MLKHSYSYDDSSLENPEKTFDEGEVDGDAGGSYGYGVTLCLRGLATFFVGRHLPGKSHCSGGKKGNSTRLVHMTFPPQV